MTGGGVDWSVSVSRRSAAIDVSGIRRAFELGQSIRDPINLSIGQPDFPVPQEIREAAIEAIESGRNGYSLTQGLPELRESIAAQLDRELGVKVGEPGGWETLVTSGTSGGLLLAFMAMLNPGDEVVFPDPWFVIYPAMAQMVGAVAVPCDTYPDFRMTAERIEPLLTPRTRIVLCNSPGNPSGVVMRQRELDDLADLCRARGILLVSDEIYDAFTFPDAKEEGSFPTPARRTRDLLLIRGFGKSYGCTGWRLGYAAGPAPILREMAKLQQYTFVCAPTPLQAGAARAFSVDIGPLVDQYARRRDRVVSSLGEVTEVALPGGAFYAYFRVPPSLGISATEFCERAAAERVIVIPGGVFSRRDTHVRLSFAAPDRLLDEGLEILRRLLSGG